MGNSSFDEVPVRTYHPVNAVDLGPALVWFHGGGWTTGSAGTGSEAILLNRPGLPYVPAHVIRAKYYSICLRYLDGTVDGINLIFLLLAIISLIK